MVIFRENTEDIYAGIEWEAESDGARKVIAFLQDEMGVRKIRFPETSGIGIKPVSREGTERLVRKAIQYAIDNDRKLGDARAQGQHHEVHRGRVPRLGLRARARASSARSRSTAARGDVQEPETGGDIVVKDVIADAFLQQILLRPARVRRDRDAEPERRLHLRRARRAGRRHRHRARREPLGRRSRCSRRRTAPRRSTRARTRSIPGSLILSAEMMLRHLGWTEAADLIVSSLEAAILDKQVTYDFARLMDGATEVSTLRLRPGDDRAHVAQPPRAGGSSPCRRCRLQARPVRADVGPREAEAREVLVGRRVHRSEGASMSAMNRRAPGARPSATMNSQSAASGS